MAGNAEEKGAGSEGKITFNIDKENNFSDWFSEIIAKAELADMRYNVKGFLVFQPWSVLVMEKVYDEFERELQKQGHLPSYFPALIPEENFKREKEHVEGFTPDVFWVTEAGENKIERLALRPTSETAFYQLYSIWIRSYKNLPLKMYQRANVWRYETKATRPFIRSREFYWIEAHDCFETAQEAEEQVQKDIAITRKVMQDTLGIQFLPMRRPEWDKFKGAVYTIGSDSLLPDGKIIQQPSTHFLGQNFSKAFGITFKSKEGHEEHVWQTCYGPAISRIFASLISVHGDNAGLILPFCITPVQVMIVPIYQKDNEKEIRAYAEKVHEELAQASILSQIDYSDKKPGEKFYFWEMKGVPLRIEIGNQELKSKEVTLFLRDTKQKKKLKMTGLAKEVLREGNALDERLRKKSKEEFAHALQDAKNMKEVELILKDKKIARTGFCSIDRSGEKCAAVIEKEVQAFVRGVRADMKEKASGNCIVCGKKAAEVVYIARSY